MTLSERLYQSLRAVADDCKAELADDAYAALYRAFDDAVKAFPRDSHVANVFQARSNHALHYFLGGLVAAGLLKQHEVTAFQEALAKDLK